MNQANIFTKLNANLIVNILSNLSPLEFIYCVSTCKLLHKYANHDELVSKLCHVRLAEIMPPNVKRHVDTLVIPPNDLFQCEQIVPARLFHTINFSAVGLADYSKLWFLSRMITDVNTIRPSPDIPLHKTVHGYQWADNSLFIGEIRIDHIIKTYVRGLYYDTNSITLGIFDFNDVILNPVCTGFGITDYYVGLIKKGCKHGKGRLLCKGNTYIGEWEDDSICGYSESTTWNGTVYKGEWKGGRKHGHGKYTETNGNVREGLWINDIFGNGTEIYTYGSGTYEGEIFDGRKHRRGKFVWINGDTYNGQWIKNKRHGKGILTMANGDVYDGRWKKNKRHGKGILTMASGTIYDGIWRNDKYSKSGILYHRDGTSWKGQWINEMPTSNDALHNDMHNLINNKTCTKMLADVPGKYCQFLYKYHSESNDKYICQPCLNNCHGDDFVEEYKSYWTMGDYICNCQCKNN